MPETLTAGAECGPPPPAYSADDEAPPPAYSADDDDPPPPPPPYSADEVLPPPPPHQPLIDASYFETLFGDEEGKGAPPGVVPRHAPVLDASAAGPAVSAPQSLVEAEYLAAFAARTGLAALPEGFDLTPLRLPRWEAGETEKNLAKYGERFDSEKREGPINPRECFMKQVDTLKEFVQFQKERQLRVLHKEHFDWWAFPNDDTYRFPAHGLNSQADVDALKAFEEHVEGFGTLRYMDSYRKLVRLAARAWGWDLRRRRRLTAEEQAGEELFPGEGRELDWTNWDIRLYKIIRSLWLFGEKDYLESMQDFAFELLVRGEDVHRHWPNFEFSKYLNDMLIMKLPEQQ
eukprot:CAMPEP_0181304478 /NCGR_PEP_ID=MMETSP1101-20121128/9174_1 /TAXON_ID=46948 /ORGANISM="Rhodomonas abbreviata, Strain Caron Lab Isolate" /LENGTH=345 /DNA_ID=CAMNT_0023410243 /DNA_START=150 /DNA_END=1187 /DNA_ORIENTATION=-